MGAMFIVRARYRYPEQHTAAQLSVGHKACDRDISSSEIARIADSTTSIAKPAGGVFFEGSKADRREP
jgi:hypothetical protein